jgi:hypothetical protein
MVFVDELHPFSKKSISLLIRPSKCVPRRKPTILIYHAMAWNIQRVFVGMKGVANTPRVFCTKYRRDLTIRHDSPFRNISYYPVYPLKEIFF